MPRQARSPGKLGNAAHCSLIEGVCSGNVRRAEADSHKVQWMPLRRSCEFTCLLFVTVAVVGGGCTAVPLTLPATTAALTPSPHPVLPRSESPVEVYSRVARGALRCWFGPEGSLKKTHVFHAKVEPPANGGTADIGVHTREAGSSHGVLRAFGVTITPSESGSVVEAQNFRFPDPQATIMIADVRRWASGKDECSIVGTGGWDAAQPPPPPPAASQVVQKRNTKALPTR